jgi:hypothetical protein
MNNLVPANNKTITAGASVKAIIPQTFAEVGQISEIVYKSGLAPKGFSSAAACAVAIMHGAEIGLTPMLALQRIAVINGRPTLWGDAALAIVLSSGLCEYIDEYIEGEGDKRIAVCKTKRKNAPKERVTQFSVADAKKAKLWGKSGPWSDYEERMLMFRARAFNLRDVFPDVLGGMYLKEEFDGVEDATWQEAAPKSKKEPTNKPSPDSGVEEDAAFLEEVIAAPVISEPDEGLVMSARDHAKEGVEAYKAFFTSLSQPEQASLRAHKYHSANYEIAKQVIETGKMDVTEDFHGN